MRFFPCLPCVPWSPGSPVRAVLFRAGFVLAFLGCLAGALPAAPAGASSHLLIRFRADRVAAIPAETGRTRAAQVLTRLGLTAACRLEESECTRLLRQADGVTPPADIGPDFSRWMYLVLPEGESPAELLKKLTSHPLVDYVEPDYDDDREPGPGVPQGVIPNDPDFARQWHHQRIRTPLAWGITTGSPRITVAVLDSGAALDLPEFSGRGVPGYDFEECSASLRDDSGHGTGVAGILGANAGNAMGGAGIDWQCRLMPVRILRGGVAVWAEGVEWAARHGARVINLSGALDLPGRSRTLDQAIHAAVAAGTVVVVAAGNRNRPELSYPARHPDVIAVGAVDETDHRWVDPENGEGSNWGKGLALVAPGTGIRTVSIAGKSALGRGTSAAAPMVAGVCSLLLSLRPDLTPEEIRRTLEETADRIGDPRRYRRGVHPSFGHGRLNVYRAVLKISGRPVLFVEPETVELAPDSPPPDPRRGVWADDYRDGDITRRVQAAGAVDTRTPGDYPVTYSVLNSAGQPAPARTRVYRVRRAVVKP